MENSFNTESTSFDIDFHIHTDASNREPIPQWWHNVLHNPEEAVRHAKLIGLDGIAITDHNTTKGLDDALNAAEKHGLIVVPGIEISALDSKHIPRHIIGLGINPETIRTNIPKNKSIEEVINWIHDQGAISIAAHPKYPDLLRRKQPPLSLTPKQLIKYSDILDGIETLTMLGHNEPISKYSEINNIPQLGGSDAHHLQQIGLVRTEIFGQVENWQGIIEAIKNNQTKPFIDVSTNILEGNSYKERIFKPGFEKRFPKLGRILYSYNKN